MERLLSYWQLIILSKAHLEITKVDVADGNNKLPNAEFTIYNEAGKEVVKGKQTIKESQFEKVTIWKIHI